MFSNLIGKARNRIVEFHMRSDNRRLAGKVNELDEVFVEVLVWVDERSGEFAADRPAFDKAEQGEPGWRSDRILINITDISIIA